MTVYILEELFANYESVTIGVYSSMLRAETKQKQLEERYQSACCAPMYNINEHEVDKP